MTVPPRRRLTLARALALAVCLVVAFAGALEACNVPVFRFALERWRPDPYRATVFHRGPLTEADRTVLATLQEREEESSMNLTVRTVDVGELDEADQALFTALDEPALPLVVLQYPEPLRIAVPVWTGPLSGDSTARLSESPVRKTVIQNLAEGHTAVWLLLESGDAAKDEAVAELLREQLKVLEQDLTLPELTDAPEDKLAAALPVRIAFSVVRVPRDAAEQPLIQMLLRSEPDLAERSDPMVFPVFGRGRALLPLVGAGITARNIHDSAAFLVGACSCEVKELNPGFDLLLAANWEGLLTQDGAPLPVAVPSRDVNPGEAELVPIPPGSATEKPGIAPEAPVPASAPERRRMSTDGDSAAGSQPLSRFWLVAALVAGGATVLVVFLRRG